MKYLGLVWSNLKRKKLRTLLTVLSILVAFVLFRLSGGDQAAFNQGIDVAGLDRLVTRHKVSIIQFLPESYKEPHGEDPRCFAGGLCHLVWRHLPEALQLLCPDAGGAGGVSGHVPRVHSERRGGRAWLETRSGAIAGRILADRFGWKVGDRIPIQATIWTKKDGGNTWEFDLVGIYEGAEKGTDTSQFFFRYDFFHETRAWGGGNVGWYWVRVEEPERAAEIARLIDEEFANSPYETKTEPEGAFVQGFRQPDRQYRRHHDGHPERRLLHHPAGGR